MQQSLAKELLRAAQPHIPALGFSLESLHTAAQQHSLASTSTVATLFPTPQQASRSLLEQYDRQYLEFTAKEQSSRHSGLRTIEEQDIAYSDARDILRAKLVAATLIRTHLPDAIASLLTKSVSLLPISVPNPAPVYRRAYSITDEALHIAGWTGNLSTEWYTKRVALTNAYMLAELHMISPSRVEEEDVSSSLALFMRLSSGSDAGAASDRKSDFPSLSQWAMWGSKGWLGILRSKGF